jgi:aspartate/methionine/tyrosine aminotransferase
LNGSQAICASNPALYQKRAQKLVAGYRDLGWDVPMPPATMYIWARIPASYGDDDFRFISEVFEQTGVLLSPGSGFGIYGRGYCRTSLVKDDAGLDRVLELMKGADISWT